MISRLLTPRMGSGLLPSSRYCEAEPFLPGGKLFTAIGAGVFPQRAHDAVGKWYRL
ncbi:hypothetical protein KCP78_06585 [Salmonella enterica subsp. enterica]|nr:hypothetical protein KCP78_06585 [Salmonella enterica subsp. enterica]